MLYKEKYVSYLKVDLIDISNKEKKRVQVPTVQKV